MINKRLMIERRRKQEVGITGKMIMRKELATEVLVEINSSYFSVMITNNLSNLKILYIYLNQHLMTILVLFGIIVKNKMSEFRIRI